MDLVDFEMHFSIKTQNRKFVRSLFSIQWCMWESKSKRFVHIVVLVNGFDKAVMVLQLR